MQGVFAAVGVLANDGTDSGDSEDCKTLNSTVQTVKVVVEQEDSIFGEDFMNDSRR